MFEQYADFLRNAPSLTRSLCALAYLLPCIAVVFLSMLIDTEPRSTRSRLLAPIIVAGACIAALSSVGMIVAHTIAMWGHARFDSTERALLLGGWIAPAWALLFTFNEHGRSIVRRSEVR